MDVYIMYHVFSFSLLISFGCISSLFAFDELTKPVQERVWYGIKADIGQFPYAMALRRYWTREPDLDVDIVCSAVLITTKAVLGCASCVSDYRDRTIAPVEAFDGILGSVEKDDVDKTIVTFKEFRINRKYFDRNSTGINDIAIYVLNKEVEQNEKIKTVALPDEGLTFVGKNVLSVGWGKSNIYEAMGTTLHYLKGYVVDSPGNCSRYRFFRENEHICTAPKKNGMCPEGGDCGGPLIIKQIEGDVCIGITLWTDRNCNKRKPMVHTSVSLFKDWISKNAEGEIIFVDISK